MNRTIYIDFDGVLVNTPKFIKKSIEKVENSLDVLKTLPWNKFLNDCSEINNNITSIKELAYNYKIVILTHVYSDFEKTEKLKYIHNNISGIEVVTVPYYINKNDAVDPYNNVLIDDYKVNITNWNDAGGIGIHFTKSNEIIHLLNNCNLLCDGDNDGILL